MRLEIHCNLPYDIVVGLIEANKNEPWSLEVIGAPKIFKPIMVCGQHFQETDYGDVDRKCVISVKNKKNGGKFEKTGYVSLRDLDMVFGSDKLTPSFLRFFEHKVALAKDSNESNHIVVITEIA